MMPLKRLGSKFNPEFHLKAYRLLGKKEGTLVLKNQVPLALFAVIVL